MRRAALWLLRLVLTAAVLVFVFTKIPFAEVRSAIAAARPGWVLAGLAFVPVMQALSAMRLKLLTDRQGMSLGLGKIVEINFASGFYGLVLPGQMAGGVVRWYKLVQAEGKKAEAFAAIVLGRLFYSVTVVALGIALWPAAGAATASTAALLALLALLAALAALAVVLFSRAVTRRISAWCAGRRSGFPPAAWRDALLKLLVAHAQFHDLPPRSIARLSGVCLLENVTGILSMQCFALAVGVGTRLPEMGWVRSVMLLATQLPVSVSGLGVREVSLVALLAPYGVSGSLAVALSLLIFARLVLEAAVGGLLEARRVLLNQRGRNLRPGPPV